MTRYQVLTPLRHNGKVIAAGKTVELSDADAKALLRCKAIGHADTDVGRDDAEDLVAAIGLLDAATEGFWLKDGRPDAKALSEIAGRPITAAERDSAWTAYQAGRA